MATWGISQRRLDELALVAAHPGVPVWLRADSDGRWHGPYPAHNAGAIGEAADLASARQLMAAYVATSRDFVKLMRARDGDTSDP